MDKTIDGQVVITPEDLQLSAQYVGARFQDPGRESIRLAAVRSFLGSALQLERALRVQTRCALVNHCGSLGAHNMEEATDLLSQALVSYAESVRDLAERRQELAPTPSPTDETNMGPTASRLRVG
jgi:hypothetical protein